MSKPDMEYPGLAHALDRATAAKEALAAALQDAGADTRTLIRSAYQYADLVQKQIMSAIDRMDARLNGPALPAQEPGDNDRPPQGAQLSFSSGSLRRRRGEL